MYTAVSWIKCVLNIILLRLSPYHTRLSTTNHQPYYSSISNLHILIMAQPQRPRVKKFKDWQLEERRLDPALADVAERKVVRLSVEFLITGSVKPHLCFNLTLEEPDGRIPDYGAVRMSMEWLGTDYDNGDFEVHTLPFIGSSLKATAAFDFPLLKKNLKARDYWQIFQGRSAHCTQPAFQSDLTDFDFVYARENEDAVDGCRDWVYVDRRPTLSIYVLLLTNITIAAKPF